MADGDPTFSQNILDITQTQAETEVQPNGVFDDFERKTVTLEAGRILVFYHIGCLEIRLGAVNLTITSVDMIDLRKPLLLISVSFFFLAGAALLLVGTFSYVIGTAKITIPISTQ